MSVNLPNDFDFDFPTDDSDVVADTAAPIASMPETAAPIESAWGEFAVRFVPRPGILIDKMTLLAKLSEVDKTVKNGLKKAFDAFLESNAPARRLNDLAGEVSRRFDEVYKEVEAQAREAKQSLSVPGVRVKFTDPKTEEAPIAELKKVWPDYRICPEIVLESVDVKALKAAVAAGRAPEVVLGVVKVKSTTSKGRLSIEVD